MDHYKLVLPEHLNHYGFLFGGHLLNWIDEFAYITATVEFPGHEFVTVAMDNVEFKKSISNGEVIKFEVLQTDVGNSSVDYAIKVFGQTRSESPAEVYFETSITFVSIDTGGKPKAIQH